MSTHEQHITAARDALRMAHRARDADAWTGDRNADSQALATLAVGHALTAIASYLSEGVLAVGRP